MKNRSIILLLVVLIVGAWLAAGYWVLSYGIDNDNTLSPSPTPTSDANQNPDNNNDNNDPVIDVTPTPEPPETEENLTIRRSVMLEQAEMLLQGYFYEEALVLLDEDETLINNETQKFKETINEAIENLVLYEGEVKHIFFHTLIIYPESIYQNLTTPSSTYAYFLYQRELERALPQLLERDFILFDVNDVFRTATDGNMQLKDIYLPPGKKPLILSIDDPHYLNHRDSEASGLAFPRKIVLDSDGELAVEIKTSTDYVLSYDGDVFLMVDNFVKKHPEFSWRGAKGIIAATGFPGLFGYTLAELESGNEQITNNAIDIADKIKSNGWLFANHSFTHNNGSTGRASQFWGPNSDPGLIRYDVGRWNDVVKPILGETNLFIAPGGYLLRGNSMQVLVDNGYNMYFTVDASQNITGLGTPTVVMGRIEISWYSLVRMADILNRDFFNVLNVIDSHRPPLSLG
ncbi:MAG: hypothetical protein LBC73_09560 [Oscillospiraceae bacterium]|jgi:flagellar basal body-associated protein FliL|nr:hypothetical protein [Oscillospiraceae bacterium]